MEIQTRQVRLRGGAAITSFAKSAEKAPAANGQGGTPTAQATTEKEVSNATDLKQELEDNDSEYSTVIVTDDIVLTEDITVSHPVTLKGPDEGSKPTISGGTITFTSGSEGSKVQNLTFKCGTDIENGSAISISIKDTSNIVIENNSFIICDDTPFLDEDETSDGKGDCKQYSSIWIQSTTDKTQTDDIQILKNTFDIDSCGGNPSGNGYANIAINLQVINSQYKPSNITISENTLTSNPNKNGNCKVRLVYAFTGSILTITDNTVPEDQSSQIYAVELAGGVEGSQITNNHFLSGGIGVRLVQGQYYNGTTVVANEPYNQNIEVQNNEFGGEVGFYIGTKGLVAANDFKAGKNTFSPSTTQLVNAANNDDLKTIDTIGQPVVGVYSENDLIDALKNATAGTKIDINNTFECENPITIEKPNITIEGREHTLTYTGDILNSDPSAFITAKGEGDNFTLRNIKINVGKNAKQGVQFYEVTDGTLEGVDITGGFYSSVIVNGATGIEIDGCHLDPADSGRSDSVTTDGSLPAYANIEYGMGKNVTTLPMNVSY